MVGGDGQAQATAGARPVRLVFEERLEELPQAVGRDTATSVGDLDHRFGDGAPDDHPDGRGTVAVGVVEEVADDAIHPSWVGEQLTSVADDLHLVPTSNDDEAVDPLDEVNLAQVEPIAPALEQGDLEEIVDQTPKPAQLLHDQFRWTLRVRGELVDLGLEQ